MVTIKRFIHISEQGQEPKESPSMEIDINVNFDEEEYIVDSVDTREFGRPWVKDNSSFLSMFENTIYDIIEEVDLLEEYNS